MSIFKKIGQATKKGLKQISLKNAVKLGTPFLSMIPVVGGVAQTVVQGASEAHELKKQSKQMELLNKQAEAEALQAQAYEKAQISGALVGQQAGSVLKAFTKGATNELMAQSTQAVKQSTGVVGAEAVDWTIKEWFNKHWKHLLIGVAAVVAAIWGYKKFFKGNRRTVTRRK